VFDVMALRQGASRRIVQHRLHLVAHARDQLVAPRQLDSSGRYGRTEANDNPAGTHAPAILPHDSIGAEHSHGNDVDAVVQREHERTLLERLELPGRGARALREDHDRAVVPPDRLTRAAETRNCARVVTTVDGDVTRGLPCTAEERDPRELLLRDE